ncbi:MAG: hypothetical protein K6E73_12235 [Bacteroidales bacterium]|nr:hypothetical protein [Bacteroidales bacterium]
MKLTLIALLLLCFGTYVVAQVSYGGITYNMKINVVTEDDSIFLHVIFKSENKKISDDPKLLIRFMDDTMISLEGKSLGSTQGSDGAVVISGVIIPDNYSISEAKFPISREQITKFGNGVKKLRLNTSPKFHEREWDKDKIGEKIYKSYLKSSSNSFEDGF